MPDFVVTLTPTYTVSVTLSGAGGSLTLEESATAISVGLAGMLRGEAGPAGESMSAFTQTFASAQSTWTVNHNLGREPNVQVLTTGGVEMLAHILHASSNQCVVTFASPQTGRVRCL